MSEGERRARRLALTLWGGIGLVAVTNGAIGERLVRPRRGEYANHVYKSAVVVVAVLLFSRLHAERTKGPGAERAAREAGALWLTLTVLFEFVAGHFVFRAPWPKLLADYRLWRGRLWSLVLLSEALGPPLMQRRVAG